MGKARRSNTEKEATKTREGNKQKTKHDDIEGDSNSTNNLNNQSQYDFQSQSSECPVSPTVDLMKIDSSSRRASLRSSKGKNLKEVGITDSSSRQLDDQSQSSEFPVAEENIDEVFLDNLIANVTNGIGCEMEVPLEVKPISMVNSPSFSLKQTVDLAVHQYNKLLESREFSLSNEQHFIQNPFEVVAAGNASLKRPIETEMTDFSESRKHSSATHANIQHDLAYQVPPSSQVESPSGYLKQGEPSLRHEEIGKGENFAAEENLGDGIAVPRLEMMEVVGEKEVSLVEKPEISTVSLKLNEFLNMAVDEDDEVDSHRCAMDIVEGYTVKPESADILRMIITRRGDIAKNCTVSTMKFRSTLLEMICGIILELQGKDLKQIKKDVLHNSINLVDEIKNMDVDIEWLRCLLVDMLEAKEELIGENFGKLKEKKDNNKKTVEDAETKLAECQERKKKLEEKYKEVEVLLKSTLDEEIVCKKALAKANNESAETSQTIKCAISKVERFLGCSPVDDLL